MRYLFGFVNSDNNLKIFSDMSEYDLEDVLDREPIFSDPESEWTGTVTVEEPEENFLPESEQSNSSESSKAYSSKYKVPRMVYEEIDK